MSILTVQELVSGAAIPLVAADPAGDEWANDGRTHFFVLNSGITQRNATHVKQRQSDQDARISALTDYVLPCTGSALIVGISVNPKYYNDVNNRVQITYDNSAGLLVAAVRMK